MKKGLAYITTAVLLGVVFMLTPVWLLPAETLHGTAPEQDQSGYAPGQYPSEVAPDEFLRPLVATAQRLRELPKQIEILAGIEANQPTDAISVSLMLTISLIFALGASLYLKKRMPSSLSV